MKKFSKIFEGILGDIAKRDLAGNKKKEDDVKILYHPKTKNELKNIIYQEIKNQGYECLDLRMIDVSNIKTMKTLFYGYNNIKSLDVSNWDVSNVKDMSNMFCNCSSLTSLDISKWDVSNVKDMSNMFNGCKFNYKKRENRLIKI